MNCDEYQKEAMRTSVRAAGEELDSVLDTAVYALGLAGEAGEVADLIKKSIGHGHSLDRNKLADELGDVLWYLAVLASKFGLTLDDVARRNVQKLRQRYPDGFSHSASIGRSES